MLPYDEPFALRPIRDKVGTPSAPLIPRSDKMPNASGAKLRRGLFRSEAVRGTSHSVARGAVARRVVEETVRKAVEVGDGELVLRDARVLNGREVVGGEKSRVVRIF